jgi:hypothetical protein
MEGKIHNPVEKLKFALYRRRYNVIDCFLAPPAFFPRPLASSSGGVALLKNPHEVTAMKELNRNVPVAPLAYHLADRNDFCVCRVLEECALIKIESLDKLRAAKKFMRRIAAHVPGSYVIFSYRSKRVLGKVVSHATS